MEDLHKGLVSQRREIHESFWFIHNDHDGKIKGYHYEVRTEYKVLMVRKSGNVTYRRINNHQNCNQKVMRYPYLNRARDKSANTTRRTVCSVVCLNNQFFKMERTVMVGSLDSKVLEEENNRNHGSSLTRRHQLEKKRKDYQK